MNTLIDAQFVKVIRCKDCIWWDKCDGKYSVCCKPSHHMRNVPSSGLGFCSDGELKENKEIENERFYNHCINCGFVSLHKIIINGISYKIDYPNRYCPNCGKKYYKKYNMMSDEYIKRDNVIEKLEFHISLDLLDDIKKKEKNKIMRPIDADYLINSLKLYPHGSVIGAIEQAPTIFNWISVEDDLPNHDEICLVSDKYNEVQTARFWTDGKINAWISTSAGLRVFVKAWMPLPDPYDEDMKKGKTMSDKQKLRLKPCPFCGGEARIFVPGDGGICVKCTKCQCQTPYRDDIRPTNINYGFSLEEVIDIWNKRQNEEREDDETD